MRLYEDRPSGTVSRARQLRRDASPIERRLLRALRETLPHLKWRHQAPVGPYYADIMCFSEKLVIEVDGDTHTETDGYDAARTRAIAAQGLRIMRVPNNDVIQNLEGVLALMPFSPGEKEGAPQARKVEGDAHRKKGAAA